MNAAQLSLQTAEQEFKTTTTTTTVTETFTQPCIKCPVDGLWYEREIGANAKCLFVANANITFNQIDMFCQNLNSTSPFPKSNIEFKGYIDEMSQRGLLSVLMKSSHGIVELDKNGNWDLFPTETMKNKTFWCERDQDPCYVSTANVTAFTTVQTTFYTIQDKTMTFSETTTLDTRTTTNTAVITTTKSYDVKEVKDG